MHALAVDGDDINLHLIRSLAEDIGLTVKCFQRPTQALQYAMKNEVDMVFVDYVLLEMNGIRFIEEFREISKDVPVIMTTAVTDGIRLKLAALEAGATEFLNKPLNSVDFRARVRNLCSLRSAQLQLRDRALSLEHEVSVATEKIVARELETLAVLSKAAEFKDTDTGNHVARVEGYSRVIGEELIMDPVELDLLCHAAPLHDVGKVGIPDSILLKPGKLTPDEWTVMKTHTVIGEKILAGCENRVLRAGALIARSHHEKFDGTGYPDQIAGKQIPLMGRIVAVADVFDALTTIRPYKTAWSTEKSFELIAKESGSQFDPILSAIFLDKKDQVLNVWASLQDTSDVAE